LTLFSIQRAAHTVFLQAYALYSGDNPERLGTSASLSSDLRDSVN
jgi:hypothetical protein